MNHALESNNAEMTKRLKYTKDILTHMLNNNNGTAGGTINKVSTNPLGGGGSSTAITASNLGGTGSNTGAGASSRIGTLNSAVSSKRSVV